MVVHGGGLHGGTLGTAAVGQRVGALILEAE
jgi:hypothetical protein